MAQDSKSIAIPQPVIHMVTLKLTGITPYLSNAFPESTLRKMEEEGHGAPKGKKFITPIDQQFEESIHRMSDGRPAIPASGVHMSMVSAGMRFTEGGKGTELRGMFSVLAEWLPIDDSEPKMHRAMARAKTAARQPMPRYRAVFDPWSVQVPFSYNAELITLDQLVNLAVIAGDSVGIGDWRKELKGGTGAFGMFSVSA